MKLIRIGTRASALARWQTGLVARRITEHRPGTQTEEVLIRTGGDKDRTTPLLAFGGVGAFTRELESALVRGEIDIAVHSLKDMPGIQPDGLRIGALLPRDDPRDTVCLNEYSSLNDLPQGARIGTSSVRRRAQMLRLRPDALILPLRGNVPTRLEKLKNGEYDAIILARAGLLRLGLEDTVHTHVLQPADMLPAPGQGAIAVEMRSDDTETTRLLAPLNDITTETCITAERSLMTALGGGCHMPLGALAAITGDVLQLDAIISAPDGTRHIRLNAEGKTDSAKELGKELARRILDEGGRAILNSFTGEGADR